MMINVVYLVMVFGGSSANTASVLIPQANMAQCGINAKNYFRKKMAYTMCIASQE